MWERVLGEGRGRGGECWGRGGIEGESVGGGEWSRGSRLGVGMLEDHFRGDFQGLM